MMIGKRESFGKEEAENRDRNKEMISFLRSFWMNDLMTGYYYIFRGNKKMIEWDDMISLFPLLPSYNDIRVIIPNDPHHVMSRENTSWFLPSYNSMTMNPFNTVINRFPGGEEEEDVQESKHRRHHDSSCSKNPEWIIRGDHPSSRFHCSNRHHDDDDWIQTKCRIRMMN